MKLSDITPLILTYNEAPNIARTLSALDWAERIVVVDSGSGDGTLETLADDSRIAVFHQSFDDFAAQCAHGLAQVETRYTLSLDADHVLSPGLIREMEGLSELSNSGWTAPFAYCIGGKPLRASLLPPRVVLFRTDQGRYENDGHAHRVVVQGPVGCLCAPILHDDRKPLSRWLEAQARYTAQEAAKLSALPWRELGWPDRLRRLGLGPLLVPIYCLVIKGLVFDGWRGLYYTLQRILAEILLLLRMMGGKQDRGLS